jgi:hypothetical protein
MTSGLRQFAALAVAAMVAAGFSHKSAPDSANPYRHVPLPSPTPTCQPELRVSSAVMNSYKVAPWDQSWIVKAVGYLRPVDRPHAMWASINEPSNTNPPHKPYLIVYVVLEQVDGPVVAAEQYQTPPVVDPDYWKMGVGHDYYDRCQGTVFAGPPT